MPQISLICFFRYTSPSSKWRAFKRMGIPPLSLGAVPGLQFWKALGTGGAQGFSIRPDFSTYALLLVFREEHFAEEFSTGEIMQTYTRESSHHALIYMHNISAKGQWSKQQPFLSEIPLDSDRMIGIITRATIRPELAVKFWRNVPLVSENMAGFKGNLFAKGIGEWPVFMQATFSLWENFDAMKNYAYHHPAHAEIIKKTKESGWYSEELFARFHPYKIEGELLPSTLL